MSEDQPRKNFIFLPNRIIWYLTFSDVFSWGAYSAIIALLGLFLAKKLNQNIEEIVGIGYGTYLVFRSISQLVVGRISDKLETDNDEIIFLITGGFLMGGSLFLMPEITSAIHYFILQGIIGIGASLNLVAWRKLFAKNLDHGKEGEDYAIYDSAFSLFSAVLGIGAGVIANSSDSAFDLVVRVAGILMISSGLWAIRIKKTLSYRATSEQ